MTRRQRRVRRHQSGPRKKIIAAFAVVGALLLSGVAAAGGWVFSIAQDAPDVSKLKPIDKGQNSIIYAGDGSKLGLINSDEIRTPVKLDKVPKELQQATISIEDERFYDHNGIDIEGGFRALVKNIEEGEIAEGASTLTMQLMRNLYITNPKRDYERKIIEAQMALDYEKDHGKKNILESYLNTAPYGTNQGRTAIGVMGASRVYFSKPVEKLTLGESALIAGLPQAPSDYNPFQNPDGAIRRRDDVLDSMASNGYITEARAAAEKKKGLKLDPAEGMFDKEDPFFFDYVVTELNKKYGVTTVRKGGLKVYTSVDPAMQQAGLDALYANLTTGGPSGALVAIDPRNGEIQAMVSSASYDDDQYNLAAQGKRQPGSTFKTFTLAAAINEGMDPNTTYYVSKPLNIDDPIYGHWEVSTYDDTYSGTKSVAEATLSSDNSVFAQLALDVGPDKVAEMAKALGVQTKLDGYPAETLGGLTTGVSPLEMASAYATLANGGLRHDPTAIRKVVFPDGKIDRPGSEKPFRAMTEPAAYEVTKILHNNITGGTGTGAYTGCAGQAGKTGTTDNFIDAWFVGYQPNLSTATWVGYPESNDISTGLPGGSTPASIWNSFYSNAAVPCEDFPVPEEAMVWSSFGGNYTVSAGTESEYDTGTTGEDGAEEAEDTSDTEATGPDDAYTEGAGEQEPAGTDGGTGTAPPDESGGVTPGGGLVPSN